MKKSTYTTKVMFNLLDALNGTKKDDARYTLTVKNHIGEKDVYFKNENDAFYAKRKLKGIAKHAFKSEFEFIVYKLVA